MKMIRKIEVDENGEIIHAYCINGHRDPHNPDGGIVVNEQYAEFHEEMIHDFEAHSKVYYFDRIRKAFIKRKSAGVPAEFSGHLHKYADLPDDFIQAAGLPTVLPKTQGKSPIMGNIHLQTKMHEGEDL